MPARLNWFATAARGTEELLAAELTQLGAAKVRQDRGGVRFAANLSEALHITLWTRLAQRVLYPLGEMQARGADGLYDAVKSVPWEEHLALESTFAVDASLTDSEHKHSGFVALKVKDAIADRLREKWKKRPDVDPSDPDVRVVVHLKKEQLSISLDAAGEALHRRGYRVRQTKAPLKETLAAAILAAAGYTGDEPLFDPLCGSGTLLTEAGWIAIRRAPALTRALGIERWPVLGPEAKPLLADLKADARKQQRIAPFPIVGADRDPEALEAAQKNVAAAGLKNVVTLKEADAIKALEPPADTGLLVTNPPYGDKLTAGGQKGMKTFYFQLGEQAGKLRGWRMAILSGNEAFESAFHHRPNRKHVLWNGPIRCELLSYPAR